MIVLTNNTHIEELKKLVDSEETVNLDGLKDFVFSVQDKDFEVVKTEFKYSKSLGKHIYLLITSNYLDYIKVEAVINKDGLHYQIKDTYMKKYLEQGEFKHGNLTGLGKLLHDTKNELILMNNENAETRAKDIVFNEIMSKGYKYKQEYKIQEDGTALYLVHYVDIPKLKTESMHLPEAVKEVKTMFEKWAREIADLGEKVKLPKVTSYVEDNLDTPVNE